MPQGADYESPRCCSPRCRDIQAIKKTHDGSMGRLYIYLYMYHENQPHVRSSVYHTWILWVISFWICVGHVCWRLQSGETTEATAGSWYTSSTQQSRIVTEVLQRKVYPYVQARILRTGLGASFVFVHTTTSTRSSSNNNNNNTNTTNRKSC